jgi:hypothetical protein
LAGAGKFPEKDVREKAILSGWLLQFRHMPNIRSMTRPEITPLDSFEESATQHPDNVLTADQSSFRRQLVRRYSSFKHFEQSEAQP